MGSKVVTSTPGILQHSDWTRLINFQQPSSRLGKYGTICIRWRSYTEGIRCCCDQATAQTAVDMIVTQMGIGATCELKATKE